MTIVDGKKIAGEIEKEVAEKVARLPKKPTLRVILVGDDSASLIYTAKKKEICDRIGAGFVLHSLRAEVSQEEVVLLVKKLSATPDVAGILIQLPLPKHLDSFEIVEEICPKKDVDGITSANLGALFVGRPKVVPATALAIMEILDYHKVNCKGKKAVVVGRSTLVGLPVFCLLQQRGATVTLCHSKTKNLAAETKQADILISAAGKKGLITKDMVKQGVVAIDCGIVREGKRVFGDFSPEVSQKASLFTPVPGGVGPMTVACLFKNLLALSS